MASPTARTLPCTPQLKIYEFWRTNGFPYSENLTMYTTDKKLRCSGEQNGFPYSENLTMYTTDKKTSSGEQLMASPTTRTLPCTPQIKNWEFWRTIHGFTYSENLTIYTTDKKLGVLENNSWLHLQREPYHVHHRLKN